MGSKPQTSTTQQSTTPTNLAALQGILSQVQSAASTPYTPYGGELTAGINGQQQTGINNINSAANSAQPYYGTAAGYATQAGAPISAAQIQNYSNPYQQQVVDATMANINETNGQQQQQVKGNAALSGALGGDRQAVAQAELTRQQNLTNNSTLANLNSSNYTQALGAAQADRSAAGNAAGIYGNLGTAAQTAALQGAGAQISAGTLQQQTQQAQDTAAYQQYLQQQAFPYAQAQFLSQYGTPAALAQGSSTSGTQTTPGPNIFSQLLGAGTAAAGAYAKFASGGSVAPLSGSGSPFDFIGNGVSFIPKGSGAPSAQLQTPSLQYGKSSDSGMGKSAGDFLGSASGAFGKSSPTPDYGQTNNVNVGGYSMPQFGNSVGVGDYQMPTIGFNSGGLVEAINAIHHSVKKARGGAVGVLPFQGYADGGAAEYPRADDNAFLASGSDERIIHAKRLLRDRANSDAADRVKYPNIGGLNMGMDARAAEDISKRVRGYADGGATFDGRFSPADDNPFSDMSRGTALALINGSRNGIMAPRSIGGNDPDVINPGEPVRMAGPAAMDAWRSEASNPNPAVVADVPALSGPSSSAPAPAANPMVRPSLPRQITNPDNTPEEPDATPESALAYDGSNPMRAPQGVPQGADATPPQSGNTIFGHHLSPNVSNALIATGLGMMASRSPFIGTAIGEGGLAGLSSYSQSQRADAEAADKKVTQQQSQTRIDQEAKRIAQSASQFAKTNSLAERRQKLAEDKTPEGYQVKKDGTGLEPIPGGLADPEQVRKLAEAKRLPGQPIDDDTANFVADQVLAGDSRALVGFGRGAQGAENLIKVRSLVAQKARAQGIDPTDILNNVAVQSGNTATQRTFGTQTAKMAINATEAQGAIELGRTASSAVPRTNWVPVNRAVQAYQAGTSDPALAKFGAANLAIINTYARAISPTGVPTVNDKQHAEHLLSTATGPEAYNAVLDQMNEEIKIAHAAPAKAKKELEDIRKGRPSEAAPASSGTVPVQPKSVPAGSAFSPSRKQWRAPDGTIYNADGSKA